MRTAGETWLLDNGAVCLWQADTTLARGKARIEAWNVRGRVVILVVYPEPGGWDIYVPASDSNQNAPTIAALDAWLNS